MKSLLCACFALVAPMFAFAFDTLQTAPTANVVPELTTTTGERYSKVTVTDHSGDRLTFQHDAGIATRMLAEFDDINLDRVFPGFLAKKTAHEAARQQAAEDAKRWLLEPSEGQTRKIQEDWRSIEAKLRTEISEAIQASSGEPEAEESFVCILVAGRDTYELGDYPQFAVRILNRSSRQVHLIGSLDGSTDGRRFPQCRLEVLDPSGNAVNPPDLFCGSTNRLSTTDFVSVPARAAFDPFGSGFFPFRHPIPFSHQQAGTYTVRFRYSTSSHRISDYFGDERRDAARTGKEFAVDPEIQQRFDKVPHTELRSKALMITFRPRSK